MKTAKKETGLPIVTELMDIRQLPYFEDVDMIQIGARNMQNYDLLKKLGKSKKPILLKRGLASTIEEWLMSAEYIMAGGNENVILCERGIRTFEKFTRNTLDLSAIPVLHELTHLPVVVDPSHATGKARLVPPMASAAVAAGADGIMMAEPLAGILSPDMAREFSVPYVKKIVDAMQSEEFAVIYHNCGNSVSHMLSGIFSIGAAAYHFGNAVDMAAVMAAAPSDCLCMGNVDPARVLRMSDPATVREATLTLMENCGEYPNFVASSGCDIPPATPWENLDAFFATVEEFYNR